MMPGDRPQHQLRGGPITIGGTEPCSDLGPRPDPERDRLVTDRLRERPRIPDHTLEMVVGFPQVMKQGRQPDLASKAIDPQLWIEPQGSQLDLTRPFHELLG